MDRAEATGLTVATAGHIALLAALSLGFAATRLPPPKSAPIEVSFVDEVAPESTSPAPSAAEPAPKLAEVEGLPEPAAPPEPRPAVQPPQPAPPRAAPPPPAPSPRPAPKPQPPKPAPAAAAQRPAPPAALKAAPAAPAKPAPAKPAPRSTGRLNGLLAGLSERDGPAKVATPPAANAGPAVEASLMAEVRRQLKPHWQRVVPTGADAEDLKTVLTIHLARDGRVTAVDDVRTTGITASNRPQVALHQERAKKAVMLASPFSLPPEFYDAWKEINATLDLRLAR